jgi:hypothetical protein
MTQEDSRLEIKKVARDWWELTKGTMIIFPLLLHGRLR